MSALKWYVVIGRVAFDDEDTAEKFLCFNNEEACKTFREVMAEDHDDQDGELEIYLNHVIDCGDHEPTIETPTETREDRKARSE